MASCAAWREALIRTICRFDAPGTILVERNSLLRGIHSWLPGADPDVVVLRQRRLGLDFVGSSHMVSVGWSYDECHGLWPACLHLVSTASSRSAGRPATRRFANVGLVDAYTDPRE